MAGSPRFMRVPGEASSSRARACGEHLQRDIAQAQLVAVGLWIGVPSCESPRLFLLLSTYFLRRNVWVPITEMPAPGEIVSGYKYNVEVAVVNTGGSLYGFINKMPPTGQPVTFATVEDKCLVEPVTKTKFSLRKCPPRITAMALPCASGKYAVTVTLLAALVCVLTMPCATLSAETGKVVGTFCPGGIGKLFGLLVPEQDMDTGAYASRSLSIVPGCAAFSRRRNCLQSSQSRDNFCCTWSQMIDFSLRAVFSQGAQNGRQGRGAHQRQRKGAVRAEVLAWGPRCSGQGRWRLLLNTFPCDSVLSRSLAGVSFGVTGLMAAGIQWMCRRQSAFVGVSSLGCVARSRKPDLSTRPCGRLPATCSKDSAFRLAGDYTRAERAVIAS